MFNSGLKKESLAIHESTLQRYNASYEQMQKNCTALYETRTASVDAVKLVEKVINSIANSPKEFETTLGEIRQELTKFHETEEYAKEAYAASVKAGLDIVGAAAAGVGIASMAPTAMMSIATTFGTASTGTAISALSGAAAQKAAVAWIGRTFAGFAVKSGAGMAIGNTVLALAGPIGWGLTAATTGVSLLRLSNKNKKISDQAISEAKDISKAKEALDEVSTKICALNEKTSLLYHDISDQKAAILVLTDADYQLLDESGRQFLGSLVNNTLSLSKLINETVE